MTRDELEFQANRIIVAAKASLELQSEFSFLTMLHRPGRGWKPYHLPPGTESLMNSGDAKREIFGFFRRAVKMQGCDAVLFASDTWSAEATAEGSKHFNSRELRIPAKEIVHSDLMSIKIAARSAGQLYVDGLIGLSQVKFRADQREAGPCLGPGGFCFGFPFIEDCLL